MTQTPSNPTFGDKIFGAISGNPLGFGMSLLNAGLSAFGGISKQDSQIRQANQNIDFQNRSRLQSWRDSENARKLRNQFRFDTRNKQIEIANNYLLPGITRNANLAFDSQQASNNEIDRQLMFQRQNILRQMMSQQGSIGSAGEGRGRSFRRAVMMASAAGGRQLGQLEEMRIGADFRTKGQMAKTQSDMEMARMNVIAPLMMPIYQEAGTSAPLMQSRISAPRNSGLMIGAGSLLGNLGGFFNSNIG